LAAIGIDSTEAAGKMPRGTTMAKCHLPSYYFAKATVSTFLYYSIIMKIAAIRSIFATKNPPECFAAGPGFH